MRSTVLTLFTLATLAVSAPSARAEDGEIEIKVATVAPDGTPWSELLKRVRTRFKKDTNKKVKLKVYLGGRLGGEKESLRETREGRVQMWGGSTGAMATIVPELYVLEAPYIFDSDAEADFVLNAVRENVRGLLAKQGFVFYQYSENGWHGLALKDRCVKSLADLKGKKIRSQEARIHLDTFKALGANPVEMAVPDVLQALQQGVVDGFSNTPLFSFATSWYQGIGYYTDTDHIYQGAVIVYSKKWFDSLKDEAVKKVLLEGVAGDEDFGRQGIRSIRGGLIDNFRKSKIEVCTITPELKAEMKNATKDIFGQYKKQATTPDGRAFFAAIEKAKSDFAALQKKK